MLSRLRTSRWFRGPDEVRVTVMIEQTSNPGRWSGIPTRRTFLSVAAGLFAVTTVKGDAARIERKKPFRWLAFYGATADEAVLTTYDLVVLDSGYRGAIDAISRTGTKACGYLSLGEIRTSDPFVQFLDPAALLQENANWPGTRRVDIRHPSWRSLVLDRQIPFLAARGFSGVMLDTLDTPPYLEHEDPVRYEGMREAAIVLVDSIRQRWPETTLVVNRGYALLPNLVDKVDAVIAESFMTSPDQHTGKFMWLDSHQVAAQLALLSPAVSKVPPLPILSLDYWDPSDVRTISEIYLKERALGHHPYVATRLLDRIVPENG
jgi:polysaccharide biosynthesis protein PelA